MKITADDVLRTANLANLKLDSADIDSSIDDMETFLGFCSQLDEVDVEGVTPSIGVVFEKNAVRRDEILPSLDKSEVLKNAPEHTEKGFSVPKILE